MIKIFEKCPVRKIDLAPLSLSFFTVFKVMSPWCLLGVLVCPKNMHIYYEEQFRTPVAVLHLERMNEITFESSSSKTFISTLVTMIDLGSSFSSPPDTLRRASLSPPLEADPAGDRLFWEKTQLQL